ncbi:hypothetical protein BH20BAC1_BH20BAC1_22530 [soil metagenome]
MCPAILLELNSSGVLLTKRKQQVVGSNLVEKLANKVSKTDELNVVQFCGWFGLIETKTIPCPRNIITEV